MGQLKLAIMGLGEMGRAYCAAVAGDTRFELVAVADADAERLHRFHADDSVRVYEDYRSLIVETAHTGLDGLVIALEPFQSLEFMPLAAERNVTVLHTPPPARTVDEARRLADVFEKGNASILVARCWPDLTTLVSAEETGTWLGEVRAVDALVATDGSVDGWRGDATRAGGGVLLNGAYEAIDWLVQLLGLPASVHAPCAMAVAVGSPRRYDTEDVAMVTLHFGDGRLGHVTAFRDAAQAAWRATLIGTNSTAELSADGLTISPRSDSTTAIRRDAGDDPLGSSLGALAGAIRGDRKSACRIERHVEVLAVIQAAYLSARTNLPESPDRFL